MFASSRSHHPAKRKKEETRNFIYLFHPVPYLPSSLQNLRLEFVQELEDSTVYLYKVFHLNRLTQVSKLLMILQLFEDTIYLKKNR